MAIKTMSMSTGNHSYDEGWHELEITKAEYGTWEGTDASKQYLDMWFKDYPENFKMRVFEAHTKESNEEFKIANIFKRANAGIVSVLKDPTGKRPVIQYDDEPSGLVGKSINAYFYKKAGKDGKSYAQPFEDIAPVAQQGEHLSYTDDDVKGIKASVEKRVAKVVKPVERTTVSADDIPF